jgi:hypothetical protein
VVWVSFKTKVTNWTQGLLLLVSRRIRLAEGRAGRAYGIGAQQRQEVAFENQTQDEQDHHTAQAQMQPAYLKAATAAAFIAAIFNIITAPTWCPAHVESLSPAGSFRRR